MDGGDSVDINAPRHMIKSKAKVVDKVLERVSEGASTTHRGNRSLSIVYAVWVLYQAGRTTKHYEV